MLFRSPLKIGEGGIVAFAGRALSAIESNTAFTAADRRWFGEDRMARYVRMR
jgi:hypothetical protein